MSDEVAIVSELPVLVVSTVKTYDEKLCGYLEHLGLPSENLFAAVDDRRKVINNLPDAIDRLTGPRRAEAIYISKMAAACGAGLFDAGLTYLWDAVVANLRERVARFDLAYFYDTAVPNAKERSDYNSADDLKNLDDSRLVSGCHKCGILTDVAYKLLDHIRDMRNWSSAAHPNNAEVGGLQLVGYLETCVKEVFAVELTGHAVVASQLLHNVRTQTLTIGDVAPVVVKLAEVPTETAAALLRSVVGMYSDLKQDKRVLDNIALLAPTMWKAAPDEARHEVGLKYAALAANAEVDRKNRVREFLDLVGGLTFLTDNDRAVEMLEKVNQLESAHFAFNNFYNEPPLARELRKYVPSTGEVPAGVNDAYVRTLIYCCLGRNSGIANNAGQAYNEMLSLFTDAQLRVFLHLPFDQNTRIKLSTEMLAKRFVTLASYFRPRSRNRSIVAALDYIAKSTPAQIAHLHNDTAYKKLLDNLMG